jgi:hypothetical protein
MRNRKTALSALVLSILVLGDGMASAQGATPKPVYSTSVDWKTNQITVTANVGFTGMHAILPNARAIGEQIIANDLPAMARSAFFPLVVDSYSTVGELATKAPTIYSAVENLLSPRYETYAKLSSNLRALEVRYTLPIFPNLARPFIDQVHANPPAQLLSFVPTTRFTGIVIYAKGSLPVHGENSTAAVTPCLFPKIWDESMQLLASADTVDPAALAKWGVAAYTDSTNETPFTARIGLNPYRTVATGIFGKYGTDIIISDQAASRILASKENIDLLTQGRILIIADSSAVTGGK